MKYCDKCFALILDSGQGHKEWCPRKKREPTDVLKDLDELFGTLKKNTKKSQ